MNNEIVENYRSEIIKEYGDPTPQVIDGRTFRVINSNLQEFDKIIADLVEIETSMKEPISDDALEVICFYCLQADTGHIKNISKSLKTLKNSFSYTRHARKRAVALFEDITKDKLIIENNVLLLINYFHAHLKTALDTFENYRFKNL